MKILGVQSDSFIRMWMKVPNRVEILRFVELIFSEMFSACEKFTSHLLEVKRSRSGFHFSRFAISQVNFVTHELVFSNKICREE